VGLNGAASLSVVVIYGVLEVDFFCTLFLKIAVFWPDLQSLWRGTHRSRRWYFPDVLRNRQVELAYLGNVLPLGPKPGLARSFYIVIKIIEIDREIYHQKSETLTGATTYMQRTKDLYTLAYLFIPQTMQRN